MTSLGDYGQIERGGGLRWFTPSPAHFPKYNTLNPDNAKGCQNFTAMEKMKYDLKQGFFEVNTEKPS